MADSIQTLLSSLTLGVRNCRFGLRRFYFLDNVFFCEVVSVPFEWTVLRGESAPYQIRCDGDGQLIYAPEDSAQLVRAPDSITARQWSNASLPHVGPKRAMRRHCEKTHAKAEAYTNRVRLEANAKGFKAQGLPLR